MTGIASTGKSGWTNARISAHFFRAVKACDLIDFTADHGGQSWADPRHAEQVLMHRFSLKLGRDSFFLRLHLLRDQMVQGQLLAQKCCVRFRQCQSVQEAQTAHPKDVATLWQLEFALPIQEGVDAVAQHGAKARPLKSLPQQIFARPCLAPWHMCTSYQVTAQQCS